MSLTRWMNQPHAEYAAIRLSALLLTGLGVVMVTSATSVQSIFTNNGNAMALARSQWIAAVIGLIAMYSLSRLDVYYLRKFAGGLMLFAIFALLAVLAFGTAVYGQRNWIAIGGFTLQPSELAKLAIVIWAADVWSRRFESLHDPGALISPVFYGVGIVIVLVLLEGDAGTVMILSGIMASMLVVVGIPLRVFGLLAGLAVAAIGVLTVAEPYRVDRFRAWLNPALDPSGFGYQTIHGKGALGSGGLLGAGFGGSREKWGTLPAAGSDFIFAVIGEEVGLIGTLSVLLLFALLLWGIVRIALRTKDTFVMLTAAGIGGWISIQMMLNIGAVLQIVPITGVPLPLVSAGGTSLMVTLAAIGILLAFAKERA